MTDCHICGNELDSGVTVCPYCETRQKKSSIFATSSDNHKTINLEIGRPFVEAALAKLLKNIEIAREEGVRVLTVIHGYGSSGKGGRIRIECRKMLDHLMREGTIESYIIGEEFSRRHGPAKMVLRRFPGLTKNVHLNNRNPGITIVIV